MENSKLSSDGARLRFFTSAEVAEILKMHPQVITRKLQAGDIAGYKLGKDWRVSEAQLMDFLEKHSNASASSRVAASEPARTKKLRTSSQSRS